MSKNISNLSGKVGLKYNLFQKISDNVLNNHPKDNKDIANEYNLGVSTVYGAESFYEFLRPAHREKKAFVCNGSACMCSGTQDKLKETLREKLGKDKVGTMFCLGYCYENNAFHYNGENYAGKDIEKIDQILKGEKIKQDKFFSEDTKITSIDHSNSIVILGNKDAITRVKNFIYKYIDIFVQCTYMCLLSLYIIQCTCIFGSF